MKKILSLLILLFVLGDLSAQSLSKNHATYEIGSLKSQGPNDGKNAFNSFAGSFNTLFNDDQAGASFDLSLETYHYFIVFGKKQDTVKVSTPGQSDRDVIRTKYSGLDIFLLNRASVNFDSVQTIANDYLTSLQTSPLTLRISKEFYFSKNKEITENDYSPVVSLIVTGDGRAIPFGDVNNKVSLGGSGHLYATISILLKRIEFDPEGNEIDKGTMYFQPSLGVAVGTNEMMENVFLNQENKVLLSSEIRLGFKSDENSVKDWGLLARYTWEDISGPKFRLGITASPQ